MLLALTLLLAMTDAPAPQPQAGHEVLIAALGADDFDDRETAQEALLSRKDRAMIRPLIRAAAGADPEIARRADFILSKMFDPVNYGAMGITAPSFVSIAGERLYTTEMVEEKDVNGVTVQMFYTIRLPSDGTLTDLAVELGSGVLRDRGETPGKPGYDRENDPLNETLQKMASVRFIRAIRADGGSKWLCQIVGHQLDFADNVDRK